MNGWVDGAFFAGLVATLALGTWTGSRNRHTEGKSLEGAPELSDHESRWDIKHIRDDIGWLAAGLAITNGLLAAILATLLTR